MQNELKTFLEEENTRFHDDYCAFELADTITKPEYEKYKSWLQDHDTRLVNKVLEIVGEEVEEIYNNDADRNGMWWKGFSFGLDAILKKINNLTI